MPHYFEKSPNVSSAERTVDVVLPDVAFSMVTDRGVFSHGHVDTGTALLLREASPPPAEGDLLDLGCGSGPVALTLALRSPAATVWAVDTNERARSLTRSNADANGLTNVRVCEPDAVPYDIRFTAIWSNPPIRIGKPQLQSLLHRWLSRLEASASATLVVQKHLGADSLQRWLNSEGFATTRRSSKAGFRLLEVHARSRSSPTGGPT